MHKSDSASYGIEFYNDIFEQSRDAIKKGNAKNPLQVCVESESQGGFESHVKIRNFDFTIDQPQSFGGTNKGPKPSEVLLASLAACQEVTWRLYAAANGIPLTAICVRLTGVQDLRGFLNINDGISAGFQHIVGTVTIESPAGEREINHLKKIVDTHCPVLDDLRRPVKVDMKLKYAVSEE